MGGSGAQSGTKIYISADTQGVVGAATGDQLDSSELGHGHFREFFTAEVNAAAAGPFGVPVIMVSGNDAAVAAALPLAVSWCGRKMNHDHSRSA